MSKVFGFWFLWAVEMYLLNELSDWDVRILLYWEVENFNYKHTNKMVAGSIPTTNKININTNTHISIFSFTKHYKTEDVFINNLSKA